VSLLFSCLITPPCSCSPICLYVLLVLPPSFHLSLPSPLLSSSSLPLYSPVPLRSTPTSSPPPLSPLLGHAQRQNAALARPTSEMCLAHLPHSAVSLFLCLLPVPLLLPSEQHPPFTSNPLFDSSRRPVPCTNTFGPPLIWSTPHFHKQCLPS
jgi:hypothetical protein